MDAVEALEALLAAEPAARPDLAGQPQQQQQQGLGLPTMSKAVQGMILLNLSAALFGSNQVVNQSSHFIDASCCLLKSRRAQHIKSKNLLPVESVCSTWRIRMHVMMTFCHTACHLVVNCKLQPCHY